MKKTLKIAMIIATILSVMLSYGNILLSLAAESELTLTPKPETNNIHLKWTGPQNSSYKVYQKKPGATQFETIGLTDFSNTDEEVKVLNVYPDNQSVNTILWNTTEFNIPTVHVRYNDGEEKDILKSALLKAWMEGRYYNRR